MKGGDPTPNYELAATKAAQRHGIDPKVFKAMIRQESGFNKNARSGAGAQGIAQFMPATAKAYGVNLNDNRATDDLDGAARYLADNLKKTGGNYHQALSIYNSGRPDAYKDPGFAQGQTYNYVKTILGSAGRETGGGSTPSPASRSTRTTGGVDNSQARAAAVSQFLGSKTADPLDFALQVRSLKDTPGQKVTTSTPGSSSTGATGKRSKLLELFWQGKGGIDVKNGQKVPQGFVSGHRDHVHVAAGPKTVVQLGKLAQQMGLQVGGHPAFNGGKSVTSGHAPDSYHYKGEAVDVSGDPRLMRHFAATVAHRYGLKVNG